MFLVLAAVSPATCAQITLTPDTTDMEFGDSLSLGFSALTNGSIVNISIVATDSDPGMSYIFYNITGLNLPFALENGSLMVNRTSNIDSANVTSFHGGSGHGPYNLNHSWSRNFDATTYHYILLQGMVVNQHQPCSFSLRFSGTKQGIDDSTMSMTINGISTSDVTFEIAVNGVSELNRTIRFVDRTPPAGVTNLRSTSASTSSITWAWENPSDPDFSHVMVYVGGEFKANVTGTGYTASGLSANTAYRIELKTVDTSGNVNPTAVSHTAYTERQTSGGGGGGGGGGGVGGGFFFASGGGALPYEYLRVSVPASFVETDESGKQTITIYLPAAGEDVNIFTRSIVAKPKGLKITVETEEILTPVNDNVTGVIKSVTLETEPPIMGDVEALGGKFLFYVSSRLGSLPSINDTAAIRFQMKDAPGSEEEEAFRIGAYRESLEITAFAYLSDIRTINITGTSPATIKMSISQEWVTDHGGRNSIRIMRLSDGIAKILPTRQEGYDQFTNYNFVAESPEGLSTFALVSVKQATVIPELPTLPATLPTIKEITSTVKPTTSPTTVVTEVVQEEGMPPLYIAAAIILIIVVIAANIYFIHRSR